MIRIPGMRTPFRPYNAQDIEHRLYVAERALGQIADAVVSDPDSSAPYVAQIILDWQEMRP